MTLNPEVNDDDLITKKIYSETETKVEELLTLLYPDIESQLDTVKLMRNEEIREIYLDLNTMLPKLGETVGNNKEIDDEMVLKELCEDEMNRDKVMVGINYLLHRLYQRILNENVIKSAVVTKTAAIIDNYLEPWMKSHQGWKGLIVNKPNKIYKTKEKEFKRINLTDKMPLMIILALILMGLINRSEGILAYDCCKPQMGKIYSLMDLDECPEAYSMKMITKTALYHVYQETEFKRTKVRECIVLGFT